MDIDDKQLKDEQELAKVLAGINQQSQSSDSNQSDEMAELPPAPVAPVVPIENPDEVATPNPSPIPSVAPGATETNLDSVLQNAISDLRPLIDKLDLPADEKFDTYLLLLRSTDDTSLIAPAYTTAKQIGDETKRATALFNIIKEINYFNNKQQDR